MVRKTVVLEGDKDNLLQRARSLAIHQNVNAAGAEIAGLMEEFMPGWVLHTIEIQQPLPEVEPIYRARLVVSDGRDSVRLAGDGDSWYTALLSALVNEKIIELED